MRSGPVLSLTLLLLASCSSEPAGAGPDAGPAPDLAPRPAGRELGTPRPEGTPPADLPAPKGGATCAGAEPLALAGGSLLIAGDTFGGTNEFGDAIRCDDLMGGWAGPQLYYRVALPGGKTHKVTVTPKDGDLALYAFPAGTSCDAASLNAACKGHSHDTPDLTGYGKRAEAILLEIPAGPAQDWILVVDSYSELQAGAFTLAVEAWTKPGNTTCANAAPLPLGTTVDAETIGAGNEHGGITCGEKPAKAGDPVTPFLGPQLYYQVGLVAGAAYRIQLKPSFDARLYVFSGGCAEASIQASCAGGGGAHTKVSMGSAVDLVFTPAVSGSHTIAVDSTAPPLYGSFSLGVHPHNLAALTAPLSLDFEATGGGLVGSGDWEWGPIAFKPGPACQTGSKTFGVAPPSGHSGKGVWGTVLNDCYNALNNASKVDDQNVICTNQSPSDDSILKLKVAIPASWTSATLSYWSWEDVNSPFDWAEIRVNNKVAYQLCEAKYVAPTGWVQRTLDLSPYLSSKTLEIGFHFMASAFVNYAGWYLDDLAITGS